MMFFGLAAIFALICATSLLTAVAQAFAQALSGLKRPSRPTIMRHQLSDRDALVVVEKGDQFWVGMYSESRDDGPDDDPAPTAPDWYASFSRGRRN